MNNRLLLAAIEYIKKWNFSVIPIRKNKKPFISWTEFQTRRASVDETREWWERWPYANIGIVCGRISNICVIDVDSYKQNGGRAIENFIPETLIMPIATTTSGGKHFYFKLPEKSLFGNVNLIPECDLRAEGNYAIAPPSRAISKKDKKLGEYNWKVSLDEAPLPELPQAYTELINNNAFYNHGTKNVSLRNVDRFVDTQNKYNKNNKINNSTDKKVSTKVNTCLQVSTKILLTEGTRDNELFHIANCLVKGGMPEQEIFQVIEKLSLVCNPPFPIKEAWAKVKSALNRADHKYSNLASEVREYVLSTTGYILSTDVYTCLQLSTREDKKNVSIILKRLVNEGIIEKYGDRNGCFRRIDDSCDPIDWEDAPTEPFSISLPLGLSSLVKIMPKNIIVVSGSPDSGKTALLLNIVMLNLKQHSGNIHYFSSEMAPTELKIRLNGFEDIDHNLWKGCKFWERAHSFSDVIRPDTINIIDYLELDDAFYKVAGILRDIHNKLKKGIAIIALQQNPGASMGRGGTFGLEKPRLYLSLNTDYPHGQVIKIVKAKNWAHPFNPNGKKKNFKILKGCKLIETADWEI